MAVSTAPAAKQKLLDLFNASVDLTGVTRTWAAPTKDEEYTEEHVWLGDVSQTEKWASLGAQKRDEDYTVEVVVQVTRPGDDEITVETRAWQLQAAVTAAVRADVTLAGVLSQWAEVVSTRMETRPAGPSSWLAKGTLLVHCRSRI